MLGVDNELTGNTSLIAGERNIASGGYSYTFTAGYNNKISDSYATAIGVLKFLPMYLQHQDDIHLLTVMHQ